MNGFTHSLFGRSIAMLVILPMTLTMGCGAQLPSLPGLPEYQEHATIDVPGGVFVPGGMNFMHSREDLTVDTSLALTISVGVVWNSATRSWLWNHEMSYDGVTFVDSTGAEYDLGGAPDGEAIDGTYWVKVDADTVRTKGGLVYEFDALGRLDNMAWSFSESARLHYLWSSGLVEVRQCTAPSQPPPLCPEVFTIELGPDGPTRAVDEQGREALYGYDASGRLESARTPQEVAEGLPGTRYEYGFMSDRIAAIESSEGERIEYDWTYGRLSEVRQVGEGDPIHTFRYGRIYSSPEPIRTVSHTRPRGGTTHYWFFAERRRVFLVNRELANEQRHVAWQEDANRPLWELDFDGTTRTFDAWVDDDPVTITEPSGNVVQIAYEPAGVNLDDPRRRPIASITDSLGLVRSVTYGADGRPIARSNGEGESVTLTYSGPTLESSTSPAGKTRDFRSYGLHGHWVEAVTPGLASQGLVVARAFTAAGDPIVPAAGFHPGGELYRGYDGNRRLQSILLAATDETGLVGAESSVTIERRSDGSVSAVRRPHGGDHEFGFDALGRRDLVREKVNGVWQETTTEYDLDGNVTAIDRPNGMREEFEYDLYGRLTAQRALRDGTVEGHATVLWMNALPVESYDSVRDQTTTTAYDAAGRPHVSQYSALGETEILGYDVRGRVTSRQLGFGAETLELGFEWDLADRPTRVFLVDGSPTGELLREIHYLDGRVESTTYGNGLVRSALFDGDGELEGLVTRDAQSQRVESTSLSLQALGNPARLQVTTETDTPLAVTREVYWLNLPGNLSDPNGAVGQRVFRWQGWLNGLLEAEDSYAWDELGNMVSDSDGDVFTYNSERNRLLAANGASYGYDEAGYTTSRDGIALSWTAQGRLATIGPASNPLAEMSWDLSGRLVSITVAGQTRSMALFGGDVEFDASTGTVGSLHLDAVEVSFAGPGRSYRHLDPLGNLSFVSDESGSIVSHKRYHPFGVDQAFGAAEPVGLVGGTELTGLGLAILGARVLDGDTGRFLSPDPELQWVQQFSYARGNPVFYEDRDGRHENPKADGVGWALSAIAFYFGVTGLIVGAVAGAPAAVVLLSFGAGFEGAALALEFAETVGHPSPPTPVPPSAPTPPPSGGGGKQMKVLVIQVGFQPEPRDFEVDIPPVPPPVGCAAAPLAVATGVASRRWYWPVYSLMLMLYLALSGRRRTVGSIHFSKEDER